MTAPATSVRGSVGGVVVTYHPDDDFAFRLTAMAREVSPLVVVDNTGREEVQALLRSLAAMVGAQLITNPENLGLAAALNRGFNALRAQGSEWAVAFDQDSTPQEGFVDALVATAASHRAVKPPAVIGANWHDAARPDLASRHLTPHSIPGLFRRWPAERDRHDVTCVITSGSLFHLPTWHELGAFDPLLFLDLVDTDYCLRARRAGRIVCVSAKARLQHHRGAKSPRRLLGRTFWPAHMSPLRLQYLFRNRVRMLWRYGLRFPHWTAFEFAYTAKVLAEIVFLEEQKLAKLAACARGTGQGMLGRGGRITVPKS